MDYLYAKLNATIEQTTVEANPTLTGDENNLTSIRIASTNYKVADEVVVDSELSNSSTNPVQNRVITSALSEKADTNGDYLNLGAGKLLYQTTEPTADNTDGLKIVVLSSEPQTKYNGYLYIITGGALT